MRLPMVGIMAHDYTILRNFAYHQSTGQLDVSLIAVWRHWVHMLRTPGMLMVRAIGEAESQVDYIRRWKNWYFAATVNFPEGKVLTADMPLWENGPPYSYTTPAGRQKLAVWVLDMNACNAAHQITCIEDAGGYMVHMWVNITPYLRVRWVAATDPLRASVELGGNGKVIQHTPLEQVLGAYKPSLN